MNALWLETGKGSKYQSFSNVAPSHVGDRRIPVINYVQAGKLTEVTNIYDVAGSAEWILTDLDLSPSAFALTIKGNSMTPEFNEGDRIIVDPSVKPQPGDFVVAKNHKEEATFKKYRQRGVDESGNDIFELIPLNDDYQSLRSDVVPLQIIGTMIEHRKYRKR